MILRKSKEFTVNMGNYESVKIGAAVEIDTAELYSLSDQPISEKTDEELVNETVNFKTIVDNANKYADEALTQVLEADVHEAAELTSTRDSFILSWGKK